MTWTPLIDASAFTGIQADVLVAVGGIMTIGIIIMGAKIIINTFLNR